MALEWTQIVEEIEAHYPTARGSAGQDSRLQLVLSRFANSFFKSMERKRRWSLAYRITNFTTTPGTSIYAIPTAMLAMSHVYYITTAGTVVPLDSYDQAELRATFGQGSVPPRAAPRYFSVEGTNLEFWPVPDDNAGANYQIFVEGYTALTPMIETTGTITGASNSLLVPSSAFLTDAGMPTSGTYVSVRGAGNLGPGGVASTFLTNWTAIPDATHVTLGANAPSSASAAQTFFNSLNWLIQDFDLVVLFGVLRDVAAYEKENFSLWEQRLNNELDEMQQYDVDRRRTIYSDATGLTAQRLAQLSRLDARIFWGGIPNAAWF